MSSEKHGDLTERIRKDVVSGPLEAHPPKL
jgi:hypothetical protein